jgi:Na+-transporting methylmalonyl-CoA/oxaloacetate decarboxylase gamma subunit
MAVDWGEVLEIGGIAFLLVFMVLAILALATGIVSRIVDRTGSGGSKAAGNDTGNAKS